MPNVVGQKIELKIDDGNLADKNPGDTGETYALKTKEADNFNEKVAQKAKYDTPPANHNKDDSSDDDFTTVQTKRRPAPTTPHREPKEPKAKPRSIYKNPSRTPQTKLDQRCNMQKSPLNKNNMTTKNTPPIPTCI